MQILSEEKLRAQISAFRHYHSQHRLNITSLLDEGFSHIKSAMNMVEEKLKDCGTSEREIHSSQVNDLKFNELECQDVQINNDDGSDLIFKVISSYFCCRSFFVRVYISSIHKRFLLH